MAEPQPSIGALAVAKTTYRLIWRMVIPALVLMAVPFVVSLAAAYGGQKIGLLLHLPLSLIAYLANVVFIAALLRHVLLNAPASVRALKIGRTELHILAVGVIAVLFLLCLRYIHLNVLIVVLTSFTAVFVMLLGSKLGWFVFMGGYLLVFLYFILRFGTTLPLIVQHGTKFTTAMVQAWSMTRGRVGSLFWAFVLVMVPVGVINVFGVRFVGGHLPLQPDLIRVFVSVVQAYIVMTALTIFSAVVFQGLHQPAKPVRTP
ncbi:glycerophosphoryl diester phosphodiesterase membrane domain-containing protein [Magnetovibrio blakemorei]|uniref:Glycerophosphoryl diester phosphodiesterase membrane domain-containing protein n=1 Tax=Magnetovibrio blakemorei TaxID=28181 RepID=A0A1E5QBJ5_9PROT|nr:glycerophosphoryl diester phosphodiesterase membrane domain-containing protein [Magnetovibrio blakemorei]OEJ69337.1 hypothetical protein BEN30_04475 [Magnetovibrio blakemorei]